MIKFEFKKEKRDKRVSDLQPGATFIHARPSTNNSVFLVLRSGYVAIVGEAKGPGEIYLRTADFLNTPVTEVDLNVTVTPK